MSEPAPVPADQEETLAKAWAYLTPHPYSDGPIVLNPSKMRKAIATLRAERDQLASELREAREKIADAQVVSACLTAWTDGYGGVELIFAGGRRIALALDAPHKAQGASDA